MEVNLEGRKRCSTVSGPGAIAQTLEPRGTAAQIIGRPFLGWETVAQIIGPPV